VPTLRPSRIVSPVAREAVPTAPVPGWSPPRPSDDEPQFVNRTPSRYNPKAFPRVVNETWVSLLMLPLTSVQWQIIVCLMLLQLGAGRYRAARDGGEGNDAFGEAGEGFHCEAVAINSGLIAAITRRSVVVVRRELRQLERAGLVIVRERGHKGHAQVLSLELDPALWFPDALRGGKQNREVAQS
jgi:hypothetical protein